MYSQYNEEQILLNLFNQKVLIVSSMGNDISEGDMSKGIGFFLSILYLLLFISGTGLIFNHSILIIYIIKILLNQLFY